MKVRSICLMALPFCALTAGASTINLGTADSFAVLAGSTVTNTNPSVVNGNVGVSPGSAITGFPPGVITPPGTMHSNDAVAMQAQSDLTTAYGVAAGLGCTLDLTGQDLGGKTLTSGVYCFKSSAQLTGTLTLNAQGDPNALFVFEIGSTLTTAPNSSVVFTNSGEGDNLYWQVGSSATLDTTTTFAGNILALTSITMNTGATIGCGRALARNGAVTMDTNTVSIDTNGCEASGAAIPEPGTSTLLGIALFLSPILLGWRFRKREITKRTKRLA